MRFYTLKDLTTTLTKLLVLFVFMWFLSYAPYWLNAIKEPVFPISYLFVAAQILGSDFDKFYKRNSLESNLKAIVNLFVIFVVCIGLTYFYDVFTDFEVNKYAYVAASFVPVYVTCFILLRIGYLKLRGKLQTTENHS